ncbi:hypothetical protein H4R21_000716 [Coemansia helicoidea]|uniref:Uncharacterized protein n=1 Tax=Coemansia helicoidea TaxID=1286919 RepID=A0ACC1LF01_9FUNG|nr:hypothetical protein H4R21_000716 [Coemansia helicoidea]
MSGFCLFRPSIRELVRQAASERGGHGHDVCAAVGASPKGPHRVLDAVLSEIERLVVRAEKSGRPGSAGASVHMARPQPSLNGLRGALPPPVALCIRYLQVLSVVVHSLPREMAGLLGQKSHAARVLKVALSQRVPFDIRMAVASLAGRWCVVLGGSPGARSTMAAVVDAFYYNAGHSPSLDFLPMVPDDFCRQDGWHYPPMAPGDGQQGFFYMTVPPAHPALQLQQPPLRQPQPEPAEPVPQSTRRVLQQAVRMSRQGIPEALDLGRIEACAQELQSLCGMLIDNLIMLPMSEDPEANEVLNDLVQQITANCEAAARYSAVLAAGHAATKNALAQAAKDANRSLAVYDEHVQSYLDWRDGKWNSLYGHPQPPDRVPGGTASSPDIAAAASQTDPAVDSDPLVESSKAAAARRAPDHAAASADVSESGGGSGSGSDIPAGDSEGSAPRQAGLVRMSTKARGKMLADE